ncbi:MAG: hypothetical protein K0R82_1096, partial [Flavipsychrobacter sp.]|nr:hypothetical protein [Flavipsychrobacter sp.]
MGATKSEKQNAGLSPGASRSVMVNFLPTYCKPEVGDSATVFQFQHIHTIGNFRHRNVNIAAGYCCFTAIHLLSHCIYYLHPHASGFGDTAKVYRKPAGVGVRVEYHISLTLYVTYRCWETNNDGVTVSQLG